MSVPFPHTDVDPVVALILQKMLEHGLDRRRLGHLLSAGKNPAKVLRRFDQLLSEERFEVGFIRKVAEALQLPAGELDVAWEAHDQCERELRVESGRRAMEETMRRRGPHLWGRLPENYLPSLCTVVGAEFFLLVRLPEEFARLSHYEMIREVGHAVRDHYQHHRRCRLIGYDYRRSLDAVYRFDAEGEYVRRVDGNPLDSKTFVRIGGRNATTPFSEILSTARNSKG